MERQTPPLPFSPHSGFATYCRTLWTSPLTTSAPRYITPPIQNSAESTPEKTSGKLRLTENYFLGLVP